MPPEHDMDLDDMDLVRLSTCVPIWHADSNANPLAAWLHYNPKTDPWFVRIVVSGGVVSLDVPRDVLLQGLCEDLQVRSDGDEWLLWTLRWNPEDPLTFRVPRANVQAFAAETYRLVPDGEEGDRVDWDALAEAMVEETSEGDVP
ncbi:SsgA family sporulation/cell division regulator [Streptosporangium lutulentum]|uniref:Streptomyces sporulation and cell division protein, SsgA n=1 Tax=Streptosporangium lutulentum TaxID=1461250 RepID=A0ABT9Q8Z1_9ACTN|nr:SsgA family sporulation/cell division regulator [Streptosporangium lutulentum]MDP9843222.1 hypothetical protein [Streptosporangium lutulentum]